jgi:transposase
MSPQACRSLNPTSVAHARNVRLIGESSRKDDRFDARTLARLTRIDPQLLSPVRHRSAEAQVHLTVIRARAALGGAHSSGQCRARVGQVLRRTATQMWHTASAPGSRSGLKRGIASRLGTAVGGDRICEPTDRRLRPADRAKIATKDYPEVSLLQQVKGVGTLIALSYVLTLEDPHRFRRSRDVGCYLGLCPGRRNSGSS